MVKAGLAAMGEAVDGRRRIDDLAILNDIPPLVRFAETSINTSDLSPARKQEIEAQVEATNIKIEKIEDICGPEADPVLSAFIPDQVAHIDLRPACRKHDERYATLGMSKEKADKLFFEDILALCIDEKPPGLTIIMQLIYALSCLMLARVYFVGVVEFGDKSYQRAQEEARNGS